ncbi:hypothetical protein RG677_004786 [Vibrio parahaemolyticus]|uniref:hypothetical protein n=2 Tax=Vibrio parahaemolyticus TaxID=670 RepID=UPI00046FB0A4|nr:hypothetical protein [Vibrio parahaemolyticus]EHK0753585.1 hypothetical protein [Vibrio parahaemolyticus]EJB8574872.1 hypothetical protein [Vibrio parahaemolyticus]EJE4179108.1 hypothetical protein [Vibrio parahaemolyticus]ELB2953238.1 hypothetical protein [Vibrio parahaemolyticus]MCR9783681.1 hypothetical protein [Vibrio parahaemolyticus]
MKFSDLMGLKSDDAGNISIEDLTSKLPETPVDVLEQFYADHGQNSDFQEQYSHLEISCLNWLLCELKYCDIANVTVFPDFESWVNTCTLKSQRVATENDWSLIGHNAATVSHWENHNTWLRPPVMLMCDGKYHLVEGHSRLGCLKGLVDSGIISQESKHKVWVALNV